MGKLKPTQWLFFLTVAIVCPLTGCVVGQPPGNGQVLHVQEPTTNGWYWLYLPEDYAESQTVNGARKVWPLVVTYHGMKPFDSAKSQIREWQQEADRYGFVVVAPVCTSPDLLKEFPLRHVHAGVKQDEELSIAMLRDVAQRVDIDPTKILSTSWSSGGYMAHYMANRYPEWFSCVAPRQSNFSAAVLDESQIPKYRQTKIGIFYTENDFAICRRESQDAARWYSRHGFDVTFAVFKDLGHERRPSIAAAFFAENCGAIAKTSPVELARMQVKYVALPEPAAGAAVKNSVAALSPQPSTAVSAHVADVAKGKQRPAAARPIPPPPTTGGGQSARAPADARSANDAGVHTGPVTVRVNSAVGIAPHFVRYSAVVSDAERRGAFFLWTDNGEPISNGINGQTYLASEGEHVLQVSMTTADGRQFRAQKTITVLERVNSVPAASVTKP